MTMSHTRPALTLALAALTLVACRPEKPDVVESRRAAAEKRATEARQATEEGAVATQELTAPSGIPPEVAARVVASVGDSAITVGDIARYVAAQPRHMRARFATLEQRQELLQHMVDMEVLAVEARKRGMDRDPGVQHTLKDALARELLAEAVDTTVSLAEISDTDIQAYYDAHKADYVNEEKRRAALIAAYEKQEIETIAATIAKAVAEAPRTSRQVFGDFAKNQSVHVDSKHLKGDLGWFDAKGLNDKGQRRVDDATLAAAWVLGQVNDIGAPFEIPGLGWGIVQLTNHREASVKSVEEARLEIQSALLAERKAAERERFIAELRSKAKIEIDESKLALVKTPEPPKTPQPRLKVDDPSPTASGQKPATLNPAVLNNARLRRNLLNPSKERAVPIGATPEMRKAAEDVAAEIEAKKEGKKKTSAGFVEDDK